MSSELTLREPSKRLHAEVFEDKSPREIAMAVADGIQAVICNVERITGDIDYLRAGERIASASFLLATANEELAKVFILIDACRVNPAKHCNILKNLCDAFYNHRLKYAYNAMRRYPPSFNGMVAGWRMHTKKWWPESADPEAGEPAMPHDTYFDREMPLYVDWDYHSKKWMLPDNDMNAWKFGIDPAVNHVDILCEELKGLKVAAESKLFCVDALMCVNEVWSDIYVNENTPFAIVEQARTRLVNCLVAEFCVSEATVRCSGLLAWPLYHFTSLPEDKAQ